jgi:hypothetical protein
MVCAREIFMGLCRYYNSLNLDFYESISTHTGRLLSYFDTLGRMLGYRITSEGTIKKLSELFKFSFPLQMSKQKTDMIWWQFLEKPVELAVESQQSPDLDEITKDTRKLMVIPARLRVLYCAFEDHNVIVERIRKEIQSNKDKRSQFLVMIDPWVNANTFSEGIFKGFLFDEEAQIIGEGTAKVSETIDGIHQIRAFLNANWQDKK